MSHETGLGSRAGSGNEMSDEASLKSEQTAGPRWTPEQRDAISARGGSILVSAAAGSGKTAVLVERAIGLLTDPAQPVAADRLLVVTFTRAAAAEMRTRLEKRLNELLRADPKNERLRRQAILLGQANIGTIHGFCADIIREFFHTLGISQNFKIVTDKQREELVLSSVMEVLDEIFNDGRFEPLADAFSGERDERRLSSAIVGLYEYMNAHPDPEGWLKKKVNMYFLADDAAESAWGRVICDEAESIADYCLKLAEQAERLCHEDEALEKSFALILAEELEFFRRLSEGIQKGSWDGIREIINGYAFRRMTAPRGYKEDPIKLRITAVRDEYRKLLDKTLRKLFSVSDAACIEEFRAVGRVTELLAEVTLRFSERFRLAKEERNFLDYNDLEHHMIRLLVGKNGEKTPEAQTLAKRFDEIMIDEYQDVNEVQDQIFTSLSNARANLFVVGDVKQSIYGFRRAMPEIFIRYRAAAVPYCREAPAFPAKISLDRNFRSRENVTAGVNFVFTRLMRRETADIDYRGEEELVYGASYSAKDNLQTELDFVLPEDRVPTEETEGRLIAERILALMDSGLTVSDKAGERPAEYRDFCVLLRSANAHAPQYAEAMQKAGIPAKASIPGGFFSSPEIGVVLSLLQVIDNPNQDIPLLAVLVSPIYGFTADALAALRMQDPNSSLYHLVLQAAEQDEAYRRFITELEDFRTTSAVMSSDVFISHLYRKTGYTDMVLAMENGEARLSNLRMLRKHAEDYEKNGYNGLSGFVGFLERIRKNGADLPAAPGTAADENSVQIMSVHKSKGLEFPVCILAGCARKRNISRDDVLLHPTLGLGIKLHNRAMGVRSTTVAREAISLDLNRQESAEEMRILYVALTRAREKLIMIATEKRLQPLLEKAASRLSGTQIPAYAIRSANSFSQWLMMCALQHPDGTELRKLAGRDDTNVSSAYAAPWEIRIRSGQSGAPPTGEAPAVPAVQDDQLLQDLKRRIAFQYPDQSLSVIPTKITASSLTAQAHKESYAKKLAQPAWLFSQNLTPAQKGTALHSFMQYADYHAAAEQPQHELERLVERDFLTKEEAAAVDLQQVRRFFTCALGKRVLAAEQVEKERRFTAEIPAGDAYPELTGEQTEAMVVLQGAIDCTFVENSRLYIIDFKTDRIKDMQKLYDLYAIQLRLYAQAMEQISELPLGGCYLYAMHCAEAVPVEWKRMKQ